MHLVSDFFKINKVVLKNASGLLVGASLVAACGGIPKGAAVLSDTFIAGCKLEDISAKHDGRYLRVTNKDGRGGAYGGRASHRHSLGHVHGERLDVTSDAELPIGTTERGSGSAHEHLLMSDRQEPTLTDEAPNEVSHINWALFEKTGRGGCLPAASIIGYIGEGLPEGWSEVNGIKDVYIRISTDALNTIVTKDTSHSHDVRHGHRFTVFKPKPNDGTSISSFRPGTQSDVVPTVHGHQVASSQYIGGAISSTTKPALSFFKLRFIRLNEKSKKIPRGGVLMYLKPSEPRGWLRLDQAATEPINGTFLMVAEAGTQREVVHFEAGHDHKADHVHDVRTSEPTDTDGGKFDIGQGNPMALKDHAHSRSVKLEMTTEAEEHLPLYLEVHLIMKK